MFAHNMIEDAPTQEHRQETAKLLPLRPPVFDMSQAELDGLLQEARGQPPAAGPQAQGRETKETPDGHGPQPQPELAREERIFELPENEPVCQICDGHLIRFQDPQEWRVVRRWRSVLGARVSGRAPSLLPPVNRWALHSLPRL